MIINQQIKKTYHFRFEEKATTENEERNYIKSKGIQKHENSHKNCFFVNLRQTFLP